MSHILYYLWISYLLFIHEIFSFSACDEIDITFVIDTDSIIANSDGVIQFVTSIIADGSSEHTGFSAVIYGHNIPMHQNIKIISLHDTKTDTQRQKAEKKIDSKLKKAFDGIIAAHPKIKSTSTYKANKNIMNYMDIQIEADSESVDHESNTKSDPHKPDNERYNDRFNPVKQWKSTPKHKESISQSNDNEFNQNKKQSKESDEQMSSVDENKTGKLKSIALLAAFKIATGQSRPKHTGDRMIRLGYDPSDKSIIGDHDNQQVYIIFDHNNKRILNGAGSGTDADICALYHHLDNNAIKNDDEAAYFMLGSDYSKGQINSIFCDGSIPSYIKKNTFYRFTKRFAYNDKKMEHIYALTCPAEIKSPEYHGKINVGNHVQYIDLKTVIECSLYYYADKQELNAKKSYIKVKDFVHDDNTFKVGDHLISTPGDVPALRKINCNMAVVKIYKIIHDDDMEHGTSDSDEANDYKILKLYVAEPNSPVDYIQNAHVHGRAKVHRYKTKSTRNNYNSAKKQQENKFYNEKEILRGDMDHILKNNPFVEQVAQNMLKQRRKRMNNVAIKLTRMRQIRKKLIHKYPHKKRYISSRQFASRLMDSNMLMNPFGISLKDLLSGKIKAEADLRLVDLDFRKDWTMEKDGEEVKLNGDPIQMPNGSDMELSASGDGELLFRFGYIFRFVVGLKFSFSWRIFTPFIDITFITYIEWDIGAFFYVKCKGEASFNLDNIFQWEKAIKLQIGPIPVTIYPHVDIFAAIVTVPRPVFTGITCRYNERMELGFKFCTMPGCKPGPIKRKITKHKGCKKKLGIDHREEQERDYGHNLQCPKGDRAMGFNIELNVKIGVRLYTIVDISLRMEFVMPWRVMYPTFNSQDCFLPKGLDMCKITKQTQYLKAHFWFSMHLNIYMSVYVDFSDIIGTVMSIFGMEPNDNIPSLPIPPIETEIKIAGPIPLIPKISLGCMDLKGSLLEIDTALRHACCEFNHYRPIKSPNKYYDDNYMDNYRHTYAYGDQNPYYDHPFYEDQQYNKKDHFNTHDPYHYNDMNEFNEYYYSPAYHIPAKLKPVMHLWKKHHETKRKKAKIRLPFDHPY